MRWFLSLTAMEWCVRERERKERESEVAFVVPSFCSLLVNPFHSTYIFPFFFPFHGIFKMLHFDLTVGNFLDMHDRIGNYDQKRSVTFSYCISYHDSLRVSINFKPLRLLPFHWVSHPQNLLLVLLISSCWVSHTLDFLLVLLVSSHQIHTLLKQSETKVIYLE